MYRLTEKLRSPGIFSDLETCSNGISFPTAKGCSYPLLRTRFGAAKVVHSFSMFALKQIELEDSHGFFFALGAKF